MADDTLTDLSELGRFSDPSLLILASLAGGPKHGYAMMEDIEAMSGVRLGPGTLYGALARCASSSGAWRPLPQPACGGWQRYDLQPNTLAAAPLSRGLARALR